ncbi:ABC1 kinase family protein [Thermodesulfovibrio hydrogeniphilus]
MDFFRLRKTFLSAKRLREILNVFIKHGFGQIIDQIHLGKYIPIRKRLRTFGKWESERHLSAPERLRMAFEELGPTFIKLGQLFASRPDLVGINIANEFKKLQDRVSPFPVERAYEIIETELGAPVDKIFKSFNPVPIAAASIAQVHEAVLMNDKEVIVKIRRPGIKQQITLDIMILQTLAKMALKHIPESRNFDPVGLVEEFANSITKELDFQREAANCLIFSKNFENNEKVYIPKIYKEFTTEKILVMEKINGIRIDDKEMLKEAGYNLKNVLNTLIEAYFIQIFEHGFFHADPHPGNILVIDNERVALIDFGIVGRIDDDFKKSYANVALSIINKDIDKLIQEYIKLGIIPEEETPEKIERKLKKDIEDVLLPIYSFSLDKINIAEAVEAVIEVSIKYGLKFPSELFLINKILFMIEGLARELKPDIHVIEFIKPLAQKLLSKRITSEFYFEKLKTFKTEIGEAFHTIPSQLKTLLRKAVRDDITVKMFHVNLPEFIKDIDRASNKIAFSLIVSAMILSSAIMHAAEVKPLFHGISLFGLITGVVAFFLGVWLIISIIKSGRL